MLDKNNQNQIDKMQEVNNSFDIETNGTDPYITYKLDSNIFRYSKYKNTINNILKVAFV